MFLLGDLATRLNLEFRGDPERNITGLASLGGAGSQQLSFISADKYLPQLLQSSAGAVIVSQELADQCPVDYLVSKDPYYSFAQASQLFDTTPKPGPGIHPSATVSPDSEVHPSATLGPNTVIEPGAYIGPNVILAAGVYIGHNSRVGAGSRISRERCSTTMCILARIVSFRGKLFWVLMVLATPQATRGGKKSASWAVSGLVTELKLAPEQR